MLLSWDARMNVWLEIALPATRKLSVVTVLSTLCCQQGHTRRRDPPRKAHPMFDEPSANPLCTRRFVSIKVELELLYRVLVVPQFVHKESATAKSVLPVSRYMLNN